MTTTLASRRAPGGVDRLDRLAASAARDLGAHGVVVTEWPACQAPRIVAVTGVTRRRADQIVPALSACEPLLEESPLVTAAAMSSDLGRVTTVPAIADQIRVGAVHVISSQRSDPACAPLLRAYAAHLAVGIAASSRTGTHINASPRLVNALGDLALEARSWAEFIQALAAALTDEFGAGMIGLMLWQGESDTLQMMPGSFGADRGTAAAYRVTVSNSQSNAARVMATGYPYMSNNARGDAGILQEYVHAFGIERLMSVPIVHADRSVGVMHLANKSTHYTLDDLWRLQALTPYLARAILTSDHLFALRRREQVQTVLSELAVAIARGKSMQEFFPPALAQFTLATDADLVALVVADAAPIVWRAASITDSMEESLLAVAGRHPDFVSSTSGPHSAGDPGSSALHIPVHLGTLRVGTLSAMRCRAEPFTRDERDAFKRLAKHTALAWATERYQQQRAAAARIEERSRIADDLHDDVAQLLFAAQLSLDAALETPNLAQDLAENVEQGRSRIAMAEEALRIAIHQLSRPDEQDLRSELLSVANAVERDFGIVIHLEIADEVAHLGSTLERPIRDALLRVEREALVNAAKHAGLCRVGATVGVDRRGRLTMQVSDDGIGMSPGRAADGHGIASMRRLIRRHGGALRLQPGPTGGTTVKVTVPVRACRRATVVDDCR
ncbi:sensor histidine kinase [[Mycobacterium] nativiensis]|uniref:Oxygen sensor histidine kinase NreB n=1 Tax=[Mycobacterium] nativiensis TaxID=2855503 RepID=A0ABU5XXR5_9MYCO|nr:GAF domain-containing protein [Mycolicibacter sp. MYC340]MEB3031796.1 GAF domain-containing protein [Mycolicibacter sp. MYC340]